MKENWLEEFYRETVPEKRKQLLENNNTEDKEAACELREKLWVLRYGKRKPKEDKFVGFIMELKYLAESGNHDIGGKKKKQAADIILGLGINDCDERSKEEREVLLYELKNTFLRYIEVSQKGRGFTSVLFGMGQLSDESVAKKLADQISVIAFDAPHMLKMDKEFGILREGALLAFREIYPNREHLLRKI